MRWRLIRKNWGLTTISKHIKFIRIKQLKAQSLTGGG